MGFNRFMYMDSSENSDDSSPMQYESGGEPVVRRDDGLLDAWVQRKVKSSMKERITGASDHVLYKP